MLDLSQLNAFLASLGPWGILIGAVATVLIQWWMGRKPATPAPNPTQTKQSPLTPVTQPLLSSLWEEVRLARGLPPGGMTLEDVPHGTLVKLRDEVDQVIAAKVAQHSAALADLNKPKPATA